MENSWWSDHNCLSKCVYIFSRHTSIWKIMVFIFNRCTMSPLFLTFISLFVSLLFFLPVFPFCFFSVSMYYHSVFWWLSHYYKDPYTRSSKSHVRVLNTAQLWVFKSTVHRFFQVFWRGALQSGEGQCRYRCDPTEGGIELMAWWPFFTCWGMVFLQDGPPLL